MKDKRSYSRTQDRGRIRRSARNPIAISGQFLYDRTFGYRFLLACALILSLIGVVTILVTVTTSRLEASTGISKVIVQLIAILTGTFMMTVTAQLPFGFVYKKLWWVCLIVSIGLLVLTLRYGGGPSGTKSWISIPGTSLTVQTSEFIKLLFIISLAGHLKLSKENINHPLFVISVALHIGLVAGPVMLAGDLGSALVYLFVACLMCFSAGMSGRYFAAGALFASAVMAILWRFMPEYQRMRILVGFSPEQDPLGYGYQVILSKSAITAGFPWGSPWRQLEYSPLLPASHTDMIFSVLAEQFGIIAVAAVFILYILIVFRLLMMGRMCGKTGASICSGVAAIFIIQTIENIGMCLGMLPVIGVTLPLLSYGGSSVLSSFIGLGIAVSAARRDVREVPDNSDTGSGTKKRIYKKHIQTHNKIKD